MNDSAIIDIDWRSFMKTKKLTCGAMCLALALLLPQAFHLIGMQQAGSTFLPMHLPVFIGGMLLGPIYGLFLGVFSPLVSCILTGMPSPHIAIFMMCELATYGTISGLLFQHFDFNKKKFGALLSLISAMIAGRIVYGLTITIATYIFGIPMGSFEVVLASTLTGLPGICIQLIFVPILVRALDKVEFFHMLYVK